MKRYNKPCAECGMPAEEHHIYQRHWLKVVGDMLRSYHAHGFRIQS